MRTARVAVQSAVCSLLIAASSLQCGAAHAAGRRAVETPAAAQSDVPGRLALRPGARISDDKAGAVLHLPDGASAEWLPAESRRPIAARSIMWVRPLWPVQDESSHVLATFKWSGSDESYFALSQGWWEPVGRRKLYAVLSNQQFAFCFMPWAFDYTLYLPDQWTLLGVTWQSGDPGYIRLYVDGKRVCERKMTFAVGRNCSVRCTWKR